MAYIKSEMQNLLEALRIDRKRAWDAVTEIEYGSMTNEPDEGQLDSEYVALEWANRSMFVKICLALEILGAPGLAEDLRISFRAIKNLNAIEFPHYSDGMFCPTTAMLGQYLEAIEGMLGKDRMNDAALELNRLERILIGTPKIIHDRELIPTNEAEVKKKVYEILIHVYPDTVREIPISKVSKNYKPDFGVKSLKAAIEYKFAATEEELKKAIGGVFEDIGGYAGSDDWTTFFAIFYTTKPFLTQAQVVAEFQMAKAPESWKPIVVSGTGERKRRRGGENEVDLATELLREE